MWKKFRRRIVRPGRAPSQNILLMSVTSGTLNAAVLVWNPVLPLLLRERGASSFEVVLAYTLMGVASYAFQYAGGVWADRRGRRVAIAVPTMCAGLSFIATALSPNWMFMTVGLVAAYSCFALQSPSFVTVLADSVPHAERAQAFARFQFAGGVSSVVGPAVGAFLLPKLGMTALLFGTGAVYLVMGSIRGLYLVEPPRPAASPLAGTKVRISDLIHGAGGRLLVVTVGITLVLSIATNIGPFLALFASQARGLHASQIDLLFAIGPLGSVAVSYLAGTWVRRRGSGQILAVGLAVEVLALLAWPIIPGFWGAAGVFIVTYMGYQIGQVAFSDYRAELAGASGALLGAAGSLSGVAFLGGPPLGGALLGLWAGGPFLLAAAAAAATAALAWKRYDKRKAAP